MFRYIVDLDGNLTESAVLECDYKFCCNTETHSEESLASTKFKIDWHGFWFCPEHAKYSAEYNTAAAGDFKEDVKRLSSHKKAGRRYHIMHPIENTFLDFLDSTDKRNRERGVDV